MPFPAQRMVITHDMPICIMTNFELGAGGGGGGVFGAQRMVITHDMPIYIMTNFELGGGEEGQLPATWERCGSEVITLDKSFCIFCTFPSILRACTCITNADVICHLVSDSRYPLNN